MPTGTRGRRCFRAVPSGRRSESEASESPTPRRVARPVAQPARLGRRAGPGCPKRPIARDEEAAKAPRQRPANRSEVPAREGGQRPRDAGPADFSPCISCPISPVNMKDSLVRITVRRASTSFGPATRVNWRAACRPRSARKPRRRMALPTSSGGAKPSWFTPSSPLIILPVARRAASRLRRDPEGSRTLPAADEHCAAGSPVPTRAGSSRAWASS